MGCYIDATGDRALRGRALKLPDSMTLQICFEHCKNWLYRYFGVQVCKVNKPFCHELSMLEHLEIMNQNDQILAFSIIAMIYKDFPTSLGTICRHHFHTI